MTLTIRQQIKKSNVWNFKKKFSINVKIILYLCFQVVWLSINPQEVDELKQTTWEWLPSLEHKKVDLYQKEYLCGKC